MENLKRVREPLAWTMLGIAAVTVLLNAIQLVWYLVDADPEVVVGWIFSLQTTDYALSIALVVAVAGCAVTPPVRRARTIARLAAWVATLTVALPVLFAAFALLAWPVSWAIARYSFSHWVLVTMLHPLLNLGVGVAAAIALWALARPAAEDGLDEPDPGSDPDVELEPVEDDRPTVWKPGEATGTVWRTADEAAAGAPGARSFDARTAALPDDESGNAPTSDGSEWAAGSPLPTPTSGDDWRPPAAP